MKRLLYCVLLPFLLSSALPAVAQPDAPEETRRPNLSEPVDFDIPGLGRANPKAREVLEKVLIARLSEDLALDDAQTVLLVRRYTEVRDKLAELRQKRADLMRQLREAVDSNNDNAKLTGLLEELQSIDGEMARTKEAAFDAMAADLTPWQRARVYIFFSEFENQMRRWLVEVRRERADKRGAGEGRLQRPDKQEKAE
ncbi:MAG: hypothetical protein IT368_14025 [Candidatus Hydrogenedentes bacterium]|nr:hypothetical protein [Candidatus Hydrogenedentota bacterium]